MKKVGKNRLVLIFCLVFWSISYAQSVDSIALLKSKAVSYKKAGNIESSCRSYIQLGELQFKNYLYDDALESYNQVLKLLPNSTNTSKNDALIGAGKVYTKQGFLTKALGNFVQALEIAEKHKDVVRIGIAWNHIGVIHWKEGKNNLAKLAYNKSLEIRQHIQDSIGIAEVYNNLGVINKIEKNYSTALLLYDKALSIRIKFDDKMGVSQTLFNIGSLKSDMGYPEEALKYYEQSFILKTELKNTYGKLAHYLNVGNAYGSLNRWKDAEESFKTGLALAEKLGANDYRMSFNRELAFLFEKEKNFQEAYRYHVEYMSIKDTLINLNNAIKLSELQVKYNTSEKQQSIEKLKLEKQLNGKIHDREVYVRNSLIALVLVVLIIIAVVLRKDRLLKRTNLLLVEQKRISEQREKEKELIAREMHHRVKNNLQLTSSLLNLQARQVVDHDAVQALKEARSRIQAIGLIHQKLYSLDDLSHINLGDYLPELCNSILSSNNRPSTKIILKHEIDDIFVTVDIAISIGLFINEALINSIKHAFENRSEGIIQLIVSKNETAIQLSIQDNGSGIVKLENYDDFGGFGFQLLRSFATKLASKITIDHHQGTTISIYIPLNNN